MSRTFQDYLAFCRRFQEQNFFEFDERDIVQPDQEKACYRYDATYRDDGNYKTNVEIRFDGRAITWEMEEGWDDAQEELNLLFRELFEPKIYPRMKGKDADRVYKVLQQLMEAIHQAGAGKIGFAEVFNKINIRDCLPQHTVLATTWHIDDIRSWFPPETSDLALFHELVKLEAGLREVAKQSGMDYIADQLG